MPDLQLLDLFHQNVRVGRAEYQQPCILCEDRGEKTTGVLGRNFPTRRKWDHTVRKTWMIALPFKVSLIRTNLASEYVLITLSPILSYCAAPSSHVNYLVINWFMRSVG